MIVAAGDPDATRTVYAVVIALAAIGVLLIVVAVWLIRQTRVDPELLAPLERMDTRRWERRDPATQRRMLDEVRPDGAEPLHRERAVPALDEEFEAELPTAAGFDDLKAGVDLSPEPAGAADEDSSASDGEAVGADESAEVEEPAADDESAADAGDAATVVEPPDADARGDRDDVGAAADDGADDDKNAGAGGAADDGSDDDKNAGAGGAADDGSDDGNEAGAGAAEDAADHDDGARETAAEHSQDDGGAAAGDDAGEDSDGDDRRSAVAWAQD
jgi:hypothetical protein